MLTNHIALIIVCRKLVGIRCRHFLDRDNNAIALILYNTHCHAALKMLNSSEYACQRLPRSVCVVDLVPRDLRKVLLGMYRIPRIDGQYGVVLGYTLGFLGCSLFLDQRKIGFFGHLDWRLLCLFLGSTFFLRGRLLSILGGYGNLLL